MKAKPTKRRRRPPGARAQTIASSDLKRRGRPPRAMAVTDANVGMGWHTARHHHSLSDLDPKSEIALSIVALRQAYDHYKRDLAVARTEATLLRVAFHSIVSSAATIAGDREGDL